MDDIEFHLEIKWILKHTHVFLDVLFVLLIVLIKNFALWLFACGELELLIMNIRAILLRY